MDVGKLLMWQWCGTSFVFRETKMGRGSCCSAVVALSSSRPLLGSGHGGSGGLDVGLDREAARLDLAVDGGG